LKNWKYILEGKSFITSWTAYDTDAILVSNGALITSLTLAGSAPGAFVISNTFTLTAGQVISGRIFTNDSGDVFSNICLNNKATADDVLEAFDVDSYQQLATGSAVFTLTATTAGTYRIYIRRVTYDTGTHAFTQGRFSFSDQLILTHAPAGWDKKTIAFIRNEFYNTILRNLSLSLRFVFEGKDYIKTRYDANGINDVISIYIQRRDPLLDTFSDYYTGILDLSKIKLTRDFCEIPVIDNQILAKFISRDDMDLNLNELKTVDDDTIAEFTGGFLYDTHLKGVQISTGARRSYPSTVDEDVKFPISFSHAYNYTQYFAPVDSYDENEMPTDAIIDTSTWKVYTNNESSAVDMEFDVTMAIKGTVTNITQTGASITILVQMGRSTGGANTVLSHTYNPLFSQTLSVDLSGSYAFANAQSLTPAAYLYVKISVIGSAATPAGSFSVDLKVDSINVEVKRIYSEASNAGNTPLAYPHETLTRLLQKTTQPDATLNSDIIGRTDLGYASDGEFGLLALGSGFMFREFPITLKPLFTSIRDFFKSLNAITPIGLWFNESLNTWELKPIEEYYKNTVIITLGEVKDFERSVDEKYFFNSIKGGYSKNISYEQANGVKNFNDSIEFSNNIYSVKNTKDLQSTYRADDYAFVYLIQSIYTTAPTTDTRYDDDIYWYNVYRDGADLEPKEGYYGFTTIDGVFNQSTRKNIAISPKRNLLRHGLELAITFWKETTGKIKYQKSQFNQYFATQSTTESTLLSELADIDLADLPEPLYHPEIYNFKAPVTADQIAQLMTDPHGIVKFYYLGVEYQGYIMEVSTEPIDRQGNWILIKANTSR